MDAIRLYYSTQDALHRANAIGSYAAELNAEAKRIRRTDGEMGDVGYMKRLTEDAIEQTQELLDELHEVHQQLEAEEDGE